MRVSNYLIFLCFFLAYATHTRVLAPSSNEQDLGRPWITVFVHGNYGSFLTALSFNNVLQGDYEKTSYLKVQQWLRNNAQLHCKRFLPEQGLHKIIANQQHKNIVTTFAKSYNDALFLVDHQQAANTTYYTFGWNGLLCQKARRQEAIAFYAALSQEMAYYKKQGINPKIRLVCHSHGGNVALNLAGVHAFLHNTPFSQEATTTSILKIAQEIDPSQHQQLDADLCIDELIMLATPMQIETEEFASSSLFKKVYSFYSHNDVIQVVDFVSTNGPTSKHTITQHLLTPSIIQVHFSVTNHVQPPQTNRLIALIKKWLQKVTNSHVIGQTSKKQALLTLLKSITAGKEANGLLQAAERTIQAIAHISTIPKEKDFDLNALNAELQAIKKNMALHPDDPSHGAFVNITLNHQQKAVDPLPLLIWTPIICQALQKLPTQNAITNPHVTLHYYEKTAKLVVEEQNERLKQAEISEEILLDLKRKCFSYLT